MVMCCPLSSLIALLGVIAAAPDAGVARGPLTDAELLEQVIANKEGLRTCLKPPARTE